MKITRTDKSRLSEINFEQLEFGRIFSDHMFQVTWKNGSWQDPEIVPYGPITFHPSMMALHYGQAIFEGMKSYYASDTQINLFRPEDHLHRLNNSAERLCMPAMDMSLFIKALEELMKLDYAWVPKKTGQALYIRPVMFASEEYLAAKVSAEYKFMIITSPVAAYYSEGFNPVSLTTTEEYVRAVRGGTGEAKAAGNYGGSFLPARNANQQGYTQVLWLDAIERKYIEEVGTMNIFFLIDDTLVTPKLEGTVLPGITRRSVLAIAREWGIKTEERKFAIDELFEASENGTLKEVFGAGTAAVIAPVGRIHHNGKEIELDKDHIGPFAHKMFETITSLQYGKTTDTHGWIHPVKVG